MIRSKKGKRMSRKSMMMAIGLAFAATVVFARVFMLFAWKEAEVFNNQAIGQNELWFIDSMQKNQKVLLFEDQYWSLAAKESMIDIMQKGGYYSDNECGIYKGFRVWESNGTKCYPTMQDLNQAFAEKLLTYEKKRVGLINNPNAGYMFFIVKRGARTLVGGSATRQVATDIRCTAGLGNPLLTLYPDFFEDNAYLTTEYIDTCGRMYDRASFGIEMNVNLDIIEDGKKWAPEVARLIQKCENEGKSFSDCRAEAIASVNSRSYYKWESACESKNPDVSNTKSERYANICIDTGAKLFAEGDNGMKAYPAVLKFAVYVPKA